MSLRQVGSFSLCSLSSHMIAHDYQIRYRYLPGPVVIAARWTGSSTPQPEVDAIVAATSNGSVECHRDIMAGCHKITAVTSLGYYLLDLTVCMPYWSRWTGWIQSWMKLTGKHKSLYRLSLTACHWLAQCCVAMCTYLKSMYMVYLWVVVVYLLCRCGTPVEPQYGVLI